jgi:hypothetical protein
MPNRRDRDMDGDRRVNRHDRNVDGDSRINRRDREMDADRIPNAVDRDIDGDRVFNKADRDMDGDGVPNSRDRDMDGDGLANSGDPDTDGDCVLNRKDRDIDGDGTANFRDADSDSSGDAVIATPRTTAKRVAPEFFGLVAEDVLASGGEERARLLDRFGEFGARTVRQTFDWANVERQAGVYDFGYLDGYMADVAQRGITVLPILFNPPGFRSSAPQQGALEGTDPPASNDDFAAFARAAVVRYGPEGTFWAANPGLPRQAIRAWQVWNEPNLDQFWAPGPNPEGYTAMLRTVGAAIRSVDPGAEIVTAGMPDSAMGMPLTEFVQRMYAAGAKGTFDTFAVHPYAGSADGTLDIVDRARGLLDRHGDGARDIRITEIGWATGGPAAQFTVGAAAQAELVSRVFAALVDQKDRLRLTGVVYFNWMDAPVYPGGSDYWGLHTGLLSIDGSAKPGFQSYVETVRTLTQA